MATNNNFFSLGKQQAQQGQHKKAFDLYQQALQTQPDNAKIFQELARVLHYLGRNDEAIVAGNQGIALDSNLVWTHNWVGMAYDQLGKYDEAIQHYDQTIQIAEQNNNSFEMANGYKYKAQTLLKQKKHEEALKANAEAIKFNPYITFYLDRADMFQAKGNNIGALDTFSQITEKWPEDFYSYFRKGELLQKLERYQEALDCFCTSSKLIDDGKKSTVAFAASIDYYSDVFKRIIQTLSSLQEINVNIEKVISKLDTNRVEDQEVIIELTKIHQEAHIVISKAISASLQDEEVEKLEEHEKLIFNLQAALDSALEELKTKLISQKKMKKSLKIVVNPSCFKQFEKTDKTINFIDIAIPEFQEKLNSLYDPANLKEGYAPFCKHLFIKNFTSAKLGFLKITPENEPLLRSCYEARTEKELPVLKRYFPLASAKSEIADYLDIILYSKEQIQKENEAMKNTDPNADVDYDYGCISVKTQHIYSELPMDPITMMRNALGKEHGGSGVDLSREKYKESVAFWSEHALIQ
jgi:tetratricopeptide (TPR) repeat protein